MPDSQETVRFTIVATPQDIASIHLGYLADAKINCLDHVPDLPGKIWATAEVEIGNAGLVRPIRAEDISVHHHPAQMLASLAGKAILATSLAVAQRWIFEPAALCGITAPDVDRLVTLEDLNEVAQEPGMATDLYDMGAEGGVFLEIPGETMGNVASVTIEWMAEIMIFSLGVHACFLQFCATEFNLDETAGPRDDAAPNVLPFPGLAGPLVSLDALRRRRNISDGQIH